VQANGGARTLVRACIEGVWLRMIFAARRSDFQSSVDNINYIIFGK
jgi:hypothetical protein